MNGAITVSKGGKVCTPQEILTVARSAKRGLLLEVNSGNGKPYALLLRNGSNGSLEAIHKCFAIEEGKACKHLRSAILLTEKWLNVQLPRDVVVSNRWLDKDKGETVAKEDLTPILLNKKGLFKTLELR